jgi:hypothetical protein
MLTPPYNQKEGGNERQENARANQIKSMALKNMIAFAPMLNQPYGEDHGVSEDTTKRYVEGRRRGKVCNDRTRQQLFVRF